jgi:FMN phosphatase YigB (HAD superfamily)
LGIHGKRDVLRRELEELRKRRLSSAYKPFDGAIPVLNYLQKKYYLALVSNCAIGTSDVIRELGLASFFECISLSYKVGVRKPHRQIYTEVPQAGPPQMYICG